MSGEKIPSESSELAKPSFRDIELYGGFKNTLRDNPEALKAHIAERNEWANLGAPVFCTTEIVGDTCRIEYSVDTVNIASIEFATEDQAILRIFPTHEILKTSLDEAMVYVKGLGYSQKTA
jgi:hypothetical protein